MNISDAKAENHFGISFLKGKDYTDIWKDGFLIGQIQHYKLPVTVQLFPSAFPMNRDGLKVIRNKMKELVTSK